MTTCSDIEPNSSSSDNDDPEGWACIAPTPPLFQDPEDSEYNADGWHTLRATNKPDSSRVYVTWGLFDDLDGAWGCNINAALKNNIATIPTAEFVPKGEYPTTDANFFLEGKHGGPPRLDDSVVITPTNQATTIDTIVTTVSTITNHHAYCDVHDLYINIDYWKDYCYDHIPTKIGPLATSPRAAWVPFSLHRLI